MSSFHNNALVGASGLGGYQIERSLRFNSADSAYLNRTPTSAGNRKTWTYSAWIKLTKLGTARGILAATAGTPISFGFTDQDKIFITISGVGVGSTTAVFRDPSAWYHIVIGFDTTQGPTADRVNLHVNGTRYFFSSTLVSLNTDYEINNNSAQQIGTTGVSGSTTYFDGYITEVNFVDGQVLNPTSFGETDTITGVWKPKKYAGTYGTNGFYLKFADNSGTTSTTLGKDSSGNGNNWTPNNFSVTAGSGNDSLIDTPTPYADGGNGRGNYCTMNPLNLGSSYLSDGNLKHTGSGWGSTSGTMAVSTGKWYWEVTCDTYGGSNYTVLGIVSSTRTLGAIETGTLSDAYVYSNNGYKYNNNTGLAYGATYTTGDVIGVALDIGAGTVTFYKNGTSQGTAYSGLSGAFAPCLGCFTGGVLVANFGQRPFAYTPPSGFLALNTQNLPQPSIKKPSSYMDVLLWAGNNANPRTLGGLNFSPDFVWVKDRTQAANHRLVDAVRGGNKTLKSNTTDAETSSESLGTVSAFTSDGFTLAGTSAMDGVNLTGDSYVAWCWDESATPGFDIVTYTGNGTNRTIAHSLGVAPSMMIVKNRSLGTEPWRVYHQNANASPATGVLNLNTTAAFATSSTQWNNTAPTSSVFSVGTDDAVNRNGDNYVAYCFSEVAGFSKFGSYTGNGSTDGPFVFCGFRPRWIVTKGSSGITDWVIHDTARETYNQAASSLYPNTSGTETSLEPFDILSNGFKIRTGTAGNVNNNGTTYIFAAFAESPQKYSLAR